MKYIVRNCPALTDQGECYQGSVFMGTAFKECQERSDCLLKQIVNELKNDNCDILNNGNCFMYKNDAECCNLFLSKKILGLLEIEEV